MPTSVMVEHMLHRTMLSQRVQGLLLMAVVFVIVIVVLTIVQAVKHDWFIYSAFSDTISGTVKETEWGMVGLGIILGAGFALVVGFIAHLLSEFWHKGQHPKGSAYCTDLESGKQKFLPNSSQHSPTERDYVARYGQKAYRTGSGNEMGSMPQPLTPGHTDTVRIKALTDHEAPAPGRGWSLGRLLSFSWDPAAKAQAGQQLEHAVPSRLGAGSLPKTQSSSSSIEPVGEQGSPKAPATRALTFSEMAHQISSPFGFLRAGSAQPVAYDTPYESDGDTPPEGHHHHQVEAAQSVSQRKGAGLMGHIYSRKLEQAQQMQVAKTRLGPDETPGAQLGPSPRILVLRESGDVEVDLELGDRENTPDGSFARTTTRRMSNSSASEEEQEQEEAGKVATAWNGKSRGIAGKVAQAGPTSKDGHAPEIVPADGDSKSAGAMQSRRRPKSSRCQGKSKPTESLKTFNAAEISGPKAREQTAGSSGGESDVVVADSNRKSASPVFLSPATSLNSNSSTALSNGRSDSLGQQVYSKDSDSLAEALAASGKNSAQAVKTASPAATVQKEDVTATTATTAKLSSAALKTMEGEKSSKGRKASAKSHSRSSSVAASEWQDVELQSEAEDEGQQERQHERTVGQSGSPSDKSHVAVETSASAVSEYAESDNESELGIIESEEHGQHAERSMMPVSGSSHLKVVALSALPREAAAVKMVVCISLEEVLPRPKAGLLSRMLRLADVSLVACEGSQEPVYLLHPGGEYHIGVSLFHPPSGQRVQVQGVAWVRVGVADGQAITLDVDRDQDVEGGEWSGRATWLTSQHESQALSTALAEGQQEQAPVLPLDITIGFKHTEAAGKPSKKNRRQRSHAHTQDVVLSTTIAAKVVTRRSDVQVTHNSSKEYSPSAALLDFWRNWDNSPEDIQDCTVVCTK